MIVPEIFFLSVLKGDLGGGIIVAVILPSQNNFFVQNLSLIVLLLYPLFVSDVNMISMSDTIFQLQLYDKY